LVVGILIFHIYPKKLGITSVVIMKHKIGGIEMAVHEDKYTNVMDIRVKLSLLWIVVMFTMVFADIVGFLNPGTLKDMMAGSVGIPITQGILLAFAILIEIPIAMIFLSRVLKYKVNRWANIIASIITILFVIGGGSPYLFYIFFASVEVMCMLVIIWLAWNWKQPDNAYTNKQFRSD
jgi:hypothetical protein